MPDKQLEPILEEIFNLMLKKGMLPPGLNKTEILGNMVKQLKEVGFDPAELNPQKNPDTAHQMQKSLMLCMANESVVNKTGDKSLRLDYKMLFQPKGPQNKKELEKELKKLFTLMNEDLKKLGLKPLDEKMIDKLADKTAEFLMKQTQPKGYERKLGEADESMELLARMTVGALMGGVDPKNPDAIPRTVQFIMGNPEGFIDNMAGGGKNFMSEQNTADASKPGLLSAFSEIVSELQGVVSEHKSPSPFADIARGPTPPGEK